MKKYLAIFLLMLVVPLTISAQQTITVTGTVTDTQDEPMIGVNITVKDVAGLGTITDINGNFSIKMEPYHRLVFSYIGYDDVEVLVKEQHTVNVKMKESEASVLDEVVVTGMGAQKKLTVTGAVTNVNVGDLKRFPTSNMSNALAGNVPGIIARQTSGQPGKSTSEFWIRGISTFGASSSAYILVDGFERSSLDELNIEDIESFTVLKDASATAIYGSKGANGVVLITTKRGKAGKINIDAKVETSYNTRTITPEFVDGLSYASLMNEALVTRNLGMAYQPEELELFRTQMDPDFYPNVDWMDLILKNGAWSYRANLNMNGGGNTARYFVSASYTEDQGMYNTDQTLRDDYDTNANYKKWNYRMNVDIDITKSTLLKLGIAGSLAKRNSPGLADNEMLWGMLFGYNPIATPVYYSNGYAPISHRDNVNKLNPWVASTQTGYNEDWQNNVQTNVTLEQNFDFITKGLKFVGRFGYDTDNSNWINRHRQPDLYKANGRRQETGEIIYEKMFSAYDMTQSSGSSGKRREFLDLLLSWERAFGNHHGGVTFRYTQDSEKRTVDIGTDIKNGVSKRNQGLAGRFTYNWNYRYFVDFNFGYTGSENFAPGNQFGFFPAFALGWMVSNEKWFEPLTKTIDMLKLKGSYGKVGNDDIGGQRRWVYESTIVGTGDQGWWFGQSGNQGGAGIRVGEVENLYASWEEATKLNLGVEFSLFNKVKVQADYFREERQGIFLQRAGLPAIVGLSTIPYVNIGRTLNKGFDANVEYNHQIGKVFLTARGNFTFSRNKLLDNDEPDWEYKYQNRIGKPFGSDGQMQPFGLVALGLFQSQEEIDNSPRQTFGEYRVGDIKYQDINGDGIIDTQDEVAIGYTNLPEIMYGFGLGAQWKNWDINAFFQGSAHTSFFLDGVSVKSPFSSGNMERAAINKDLWGKVWMSTNSPEQNAHVTYPRLSNGSGGAGASNNNKNSTWWLRNGSFLRLKNIEIGYTLPKEFVTKTFIKSLRFYVSGNNLLTFSSFKLWDPEKAKGSSDGSGYPLNRVITVGFNANF